MLFGRQPRPSSLCLATIVLLSPVEAVRAADLAPSVATAVPVPGALDFLRGIEFHAQGELGIYGNSLNPSQGVNGEGYNFGQWYTDNANEPQLNQILLTIAKPVDPKATGTSIGFTLQGLYGSDTRFNHYLGIGDTFMGSQRNQLNVTQAFIAAHLPILTAGGVELKAGLFTSPQGFETLDPSLDPFYSHTYTYNYATTFNHTGIFTTTHINATLDVFLGVDTGNQATIGFPGGDPNGQLAGFVGFGLNSLLDGKLTIQGLSHIGPEQNFISDPTGASKDVRYLNDLGFNYKVTDALTSLTELNYERDDFGFGNGPATSMSVVQYLGYNFGKIYTLNARAEVLRDSQNFFVVTPQSNSGIVDAEKGGPIFPPNLVAPNGTQGTTYGALTLGVTIKPDVPKPLALVLLRPEIRYDRIIAGARAYNSNAYLGGTMGSRDQFTFGGDLIVGF